MILVEQSGSLSADGGPAHPNDTGMSQRLPPFPLRFRKMVHFMYQLGIDIADSQHPVHLGPLDADGHPNIRHLGRTGGDKENADAVRRQTSFFHRLLPRQHRRHLHGRFQRKHVFAQVGKAHPDQAHHRRAGGADHWLFQTPLIHQPPRGVGHDLRPPRNLEYMVEPQGEKPPQHNLNIVQMIELPVQGRSRQRHRVPITVQHRQAVVPRLFRVVRTGAHTLAAVDAPLGNNLRLALPDTDGLGGTPLDAVGAAQTQLFIQGNGMEKPVHGPPPSLCAGHRRP